MFRCFYDLCRQICFDMILIFSFTRSNKMPLAAYLNEGHRWELLFACMRVVHFNLSMQQCFINICYVDDYIDELKVEVVNNLKRSTFRIKMILDFFSSFF